MADGSRHVNTLALCAPRLRDFAYLADRMRMDEIKQYLATAGLDQYDSDIAAREYANTPGPSWSLIDGEGYPVLAGGFAPVRSGVYECWMMGTDAGWLQHGRAITRIGRRLIRGMLAGRAHRVQAVVLNELAHVHDWHAKALGMVNEGIQHGYCANGADVVMFAATRKSA
jgi:hypothetical protein